MALPCSARIAVWAALMLIAAPLVAGRADAHAVIIDATPAINAVVAPGGFDVRLRFNSRIDLDRSRLTLVASTGKSLKLAIIPGDAPDIVSARAETLAPGDYRIRWQVLSVDGHLTRGDIPFIVKGP